MLQARAILTEARLAGIVPDVWACTTLINGLIKLKRFDEALETVDTMRGLGVQPNVVRVDVQ